MKKKKPLMLQAILERDLKLAATPDPDEGADPERDLREEVIPLRSYRIVHGKTNKVRLTGRRLDAHGEACRALLKHGDFGEKFSEEYLVGEVDDALLQIAASPDVDHGSIVRDLVQRLADFRSEQRVLIPVGGLIIAHDHLELGRVTFRRITDELIERTVQGVVGSFPVEAGEGESTSARAYDRGKVEEALRECEVVAEFVTVGECSRAFQRGRSETERALDLLRFAEPFVLRQGERTRIGLPGVWGAEFTTLIALSDDGSTAWTGVFSEPLRPFELSPAVHGRLGGARVFELSALIQKSAPTELEQRILAAVQWSARAQRQDESWFRLLCYVAALESLLNPHDRPVRMGVSEGVALLVGGSCTAERKHARDFIARMYDLRSKVAHGSAAIIMKSDLAMLCGAVGSTVSAVLDVRERFGTQRGLDEWLSDRRLGAPL